MEHITPSNHSRFRPFRCVKLFALLAILRTLPCFGMVVDADAIQKKVEENTDLIARVKIDSFTSEKDTLLGIRFIADAEVLEVIEGEASSHIQIWGPGGERGGNGIFYSGFPRLYKNHQYTLHLHLAPSGNYEIVGGEWGVASSSKRESSRNRTDGSNGDGTGAYLHWPFDALPIPFYLSLPTLSQYPDWKAAIDASFKTWMTVSGTQVDFLPMGCSSGERNENDGLPHIILVTKDWPFDETAVVALTRNYYLAGDNDRAGRILDSDILLNGVNHSFTTTGEAGKHDVQNILTHEIGHLLGLGHETGSIDPDATMFAQARTGELKKRILKDSDSAGIRAAYPGERDKAVWTESLCDLEKPISCMAVHGNKMQKNHLFWMMLVSILPLILLRRIMTTFKALFGKLLILFFCFVSFSPAVGRAQMASMRIIPITEVFSTFKKTQAKKIHVSNLPESHIET